MTYNRFRPLLTLLSFSEDENDSSDKLRKIRPVYETLVENFKSVYRSWQAISIDESFIPWKGRLQFRQCNKNKRDCFGINIYKNCVSRTGYVYDLIIHIGKYIEKKSLIEGIGVRKYSEISRTKADHSILIIGIHVH